MKKTENVFVTGGLGFIGSHTVLELVKAGFRPVIIDNLSNAERSIHKKLEKMSGVPIPFFEADCQDAGAIEEVFDQFRSPFGLIHFAAKKSVPESIEKPDEYWDNNLGGMMQVLEKFTRVGGKRVVFSSSAAVYGTPAQLPVKETTPFGAVSSPYAETKQKCESFLQKWTHGIKTIRSVSLRYFNPIGAHPSGLLGENPTGRPGNLQPILTDTALGKRNEFLIYGGDYPTPDGTCIRDYIHVMDLAEAHVKALEWLKTDQSSDSYEVFNLGTGRGISVREMVESFQGANGVKINHRVVERRQGDIPMIYANADKARQLLHWRPRRSLKSAQMDAWRWAKSLSAPLVS